MSDALHTPTAIITGHMNADYDALAAMVAASKLYPEAVLVTPSALERQTTHEFTDGLFKRHCFVQPKECDFSAVKLLVVVDTHQAQRIEHVKDVLGNPGLEIHVYDHHPDSEHDLVAAQRLIKPWGSTTTILTLLIKEKGILLSEDEATLLGLGIYEDTGSFTFTSTTEHEFEAAGFLARSGMDIGIISDHINTELNAEQIHILNSLLSSAETHSIQGVPVTITEITLEDFIGDLASLVHKLIEMENLKVVFVLAFMGANVHMIARSKIPEIDVAQICSTFGGGGHSFAASASIKNQPMAEIKGQLLALLVSSVAPLMLVGRHMTTPAITVQSTVTMEEAVDVMNRFGLKAIPVLSPKNNECVGILEQQIAARATTHKLGNLSITDYMQRNVRSLTPESSLYEAMEIILKQRQRLIPVLEDHTVVGVLTRTDILRLLVDDTLHIPEGTPLTMDHRERNVSGIVRNHLPPEHVELLEKAGWLGDRLGMSVFAVGGFVRDLILRRNNLDIDLSVEGNGTHFAEALAQELGGRMRPHHKFKTAIVFYKDAHGVERHLDVATARLEYYEYPAALPTVELSSIKMDLYRRDFTINAQAIQLNAGRFGTLIDPFGAQKDIKEKNIAVLHSLSFIEDPTRILRAVRFELRFHFRISIQTERLIKNALSLNMIDKLSGTRLFNELKHVFDEKEAISCIRRLEGWNLLYMIHPVLKINPVKDILLSNVEEILTWYKILNTEPQPRHWMIYLLVLCNTAKYPDVSDMLTRLGFIERARTDFLGLREAIRQTSNKLASLQKEEKTAMSDIYEVLHRIPAEGLIYLMARYGQENNIGRDISLYLTRLKDEKLDISGADLEDMGETPGPEFGKVLKEVLYAKLNNKVSTREEQLEMASTRIRKLRGKEGLIREVMQGRT